MRSTCLLSLVLSSASACTGSGPQQPARSAPAETKVVAVEPAKIAAPAEVAAKPPANEVKTTPPVVTPDPVPVPIAAAPTTAAEMPTPAAEPPTTAGELPTVAPAAGPAVLAVLPVAPIQTAVAWREVARPAEPLAFEPLTRGVLGKSASGYHDVDDSGALVQRPEIEAPAAPVIGVWPDNAWYVDVRTRTVKGDRTEMESLRELRLMRLRGKKRWVPQMYNDTQRFQDDGHGIQIGGTGGLLVEWQGSVTRLADNAVDPVMGLDIGGELAGLFETKSGKVYTVRRRDGELVVQRDCADLECVQREATPLPSGQLWRFTSPVTRQQHSISTIAEVRVGEEASQSHLLHYEAGGWKLESMTGTPEGLWPTKDGGLWTMVGAQLLHRDPNGDWREVVLPEGATAMSAAMRGDFSELWIAAAVGDATVVYATAANAQATPAP